MTSVTETRGSLEPTAGETGFWQEPTKAFAVFLVIQIALVYGGVAPFFGGILAEPDAYMRMNRVLYLWESGAWFDPLYPRISPPDGLLQHWTRPLDVLLLIGGLIAAPFVGFEEGLHWWGVIIGPAMLFPALLAFVWAAVPLVRRQWLWLVGVFFVTQPALLVTFLVGRPDQNCLLMLLFVVYVGLTIRMVLEPRRAAWPALAGAVAALALWVSLETMLFVIVGIAVPGVFWLAGEPRLSRALLIHGLSLLAVLALSLPIERGFDRLLQLEYDQLSVVHLGVFALNAAFWGAMEGLERLPRVSGNLLGRAAVAAVAASAVLAVIWVALPGMYQSPFSRVDDLYRSVRLANIAEFQPIVRWSDLTGPDAATTIGHLFLWLGAGAFAIPGLVWMLRRSSGSAWRGWLVVALMASVFIPLSFAQVRWVAYAEAMLVLPYAALVGAGLAWISRLPLAEPLLALPRAIVVALACTWTFLPAVIVGASAGGEPVEAAGPPGEAAQPAEQQAAADSDELCPLNALSQVLADPDGLGDRSRRVMAFVDFGPELLYRTPHSVYSIPNHRFQSGFTATYRAMTAQSAQAAESVLRQSGVELVVVCPEWPLEAQFYGSDGASGLFYDDLAAGNAPSFLVPVALPEALDSRFALYAVDPG